MTRASGKLKAVWRRFALLTLSVNATAAAVAANAPPLAPQRGYGLIAHWPFDRDLSSSVNNSLYAAQATAPEFIRVDSSAGVACVGSGALQSNTGVSWGNGAYLTIASPLFGLNGNDVLTVTGWFKVEDIAGDGMDIRNTFFESTPTSSLSFGVSGPAGRKKIYFRLRTEAYAIFELADGPAVDMARWYHVALVWNSAAGHVRLYLDGERVTELPVPGRPRLEPMRGVHVGARKLADGQADWDGWLDDLAVFDIELSSRQIKAIASGGGQVPEVSARTVLASVPETGGQTIVARPPGSVAPQYPAPETLPEGPYIGHVSDTEARIWARLPSGGRVTATAVSVDGRHTVTAEALAAEESDWCVHWKLSGLRPATAYRVSFGGGRATAASPGALVITTPTPAAAPARVTLGFGSCASYAESSIWTRIAAECPDGMVLLGDTPYIDSTDLRWQRWAYRRFASIPQFAAAAQKIPFWGTWDDHDFGKDASDGTLPGKENSRRAFLEYRANLAAGENGQGVYTRFRRGPVEVFLLDTRWFAKTEPSWADARRPTLLGLQQWEWLQKGLLESDAPFKILASGMVWDVKGKAGDAWGAYMYERDALERWLGEKRVTGVILMGGDIHVSRLLKYSTRTTVGYDLHQLIVSPLSDRILPDANVPSPNLVASAIEPYVFLKVTADGTHHPATLKAEWMNRDGKIFFGFDTDAAQLQPAALNR
jgi:alkaline phosphatase D